MYTLQSFPQPQPSQSEMSFAADIQKKRFFDLKTKQDLGSLSAESQNKKVTFIFSCHSQQLLGGSFVWSANKAVWT